MTGAAAALGLLVPARASARRTASSATGLVISVTFSLLVIAVITSLWRAAADASGGAVAGYTGRDLTWYLATSEAAILGIANRLIDDTGAAIGRGDVTVELLRPRRPVTVRIAVEVGAAAAKVAVILPAAWLFALVVVGPPRSAGALLLALPSVALAVVANVAAQHVVAASAFWLREATTIWFLYQKAVFLLGGMLLPLQVLPHALEITGRILPFSAMAYAPARLASGHAEPMLLVIQSVWVVVLLAAAHIAFAVGERHLTGAGSP